jgi:16S rRNA (cytidine1402-2'-O)-methyltransferase
MNDSNRQNDDIEKTEPENASGADAGSESNNSDNPFETAARAALASGEFLSENEEADLDDADTEEDADEGDFDPLDADLSGEYIADPEPERTQIEMDDAEIEMLQAIYQAEDISQDDISTIDELALSPTMEESDEVEALDLEELIVEPAEKLAGSISLVGVPIGNRDDITLRALRTLQAVDVVVCGEFKNAARLLRIYNISKKLIEMNEHNEAGVSDEVIAMLRAGKRVAVISDAGLPLLADPGNMLMSKLRALGVQPKIIPGVSSVMTGLMASGFSLESFDFVGILPRKPEERRMAAIALASRERTLAILESPYRLRSLLAVLADAMPDRRAAIAINLTTPFEATIRGTLAELSEKFASKKFKGEFVVVLDRLLPSERRQAAEQAAQRAVPAAPPELHELEVVADADEIELDLEPTAWQKPERSDEGGWSPVRKEQKGPREDRGGWGARTDRGDKREHAPRREGERREERGERRGRPERGGWERPRRDWSGGERRGTRNEREGFGGERRGERRDRDFGGERPERRESREGSERRGDSQRSGFQRGGSPQGDRGRGSRGFQRGGGFQGSGFRRDDRERGGFDRGNREGGNREGGGRERGGFERGNREGGGRERGGFERGNREGGGRERGGFERGGGRFDDRSRGDRFQGRDQERPPRRDFGSRGGRPQGRKGGKR